jgi:hypothetical protein
VKRHTLPLRHDWEPVIYRRKITIPRGAIQTSVPDLCRRAGIEVQATVDRAVFIYLGNRKVRSPNADLVGVPVSPRTWQGALRALETLAYDFFDHFARYCACGRGLFTV